MNDDLFPRFYWPLSFIENRNPYGRVGVRGQTFKSSPMAAQKKRAKSKAERRNTQHMRRLAKH